MKRLAARTRSVALLLALAASPAAARDTFHDLDVEKAKQEGAGHENLLQVPVYLKGQKHPAIVKDHGPVSTNRRTNAANKSDEEACQVAFLSALIALQSRANAVGANAVVDVRSITKHNNLESATQFRCVAGSIVANVALEGRLVSLAK